jgi:hypothetical protein
MGLAIQNIWLRNQSENILMKLVSFTLYLAQEFCFMSIRSFFSQVPALACYEQFIYMSYSWLLLLITVFPCWWDSGSERWDERYRTECCSWPNYSHPIGHHCHSSSFLPDTASSQSPCLAVFKWLVTADVLNPTCAFSFFLLTFSVWIADCNASVFLIQRGQSLHQTRPAFFSTSLVTA